MSNPGQLVEAIFANSVGPNDLGFQYDYTYTSAGKVSAKTLTVQSANHISMGGAQASGSLAASYNYDNQGALTSVVYPVLETWAVSPVQTFTYTLDTMERPTGIQPRRSYSRFVFQGPVILENLHMRHRKTLAHQQLRHLARCRSRTQLIDNPFHRL
jgi:hypothetical protein